MADTNLPTDHAGNLAATSLLSTKLFIPQARQLHDVLPRPRLVERVKAGLSGRLTLISAPAGFGKTTLLTEWIPHSNRCVCWLSLDEADNDLTRFLTYFIAALQRLKADFGQALLAMLQSPQPPAGESLVTALVNEITGTLDEFALVLDDYHLIQLPAIHATIAFLLNNLPPNMHLILTSRADPPLSLARLRARRQLTEIRAADLRFNPDEAANFLNEVMGLSLSAQDIAALETRTEGWIAGLQLAALSMQGRHDLSGFIQAFTGSHVYVVDYLTEEVLQRQTESMQTFLRQTSILERLSGSLCDAVTEGKEGQAMLEQLQQHNLFIIPLDDERRWYRYHHLFAELLRARLEQAYPDSVPELHQRASTWYEQQGLFADAVQHALATGDGALAARLIELVARPMQLRGEMMTLMGWFTALPEAELQARPQLGLIYAWGLTTSGQVLVAERRLQDMEHHLTALGDRDNLLGEVKVIRARIALIQGDYPRVIELARQTLAHLPEDQLLLRALTYVSLGSACIPLGDLETASLNLAQASVLYQASGQPAMALLPLRQLARVQLQQGRLNQLDQTTQEALRLAAQSGQHSPLVGYTYMSLGELWYERNDLAAAGRYFADGLALVELGGTEDVLNMMNLVDAHLGLAWLKQMQGEPQGALELIQRIEPIWGQLARTIQQRSTGDADGTLWSEWQPEPGRSRPGLGSLYLDRIAACQVRLWLSQGDIGAANRWVQSREWNLEGEITFFQEIRYVTLTRVLVAQGEFERALALLARLLDAAETVGRMGRVIELLVLQALALYAHRREAEALIALERALVLAEPEGYIRTFVDEGPPMAALLREAHTRAILPAYVARLLAAFGKDEGRRMKDETNSEPLHPSYPKGTMSLSSQPLVEPLSKRELEILSLMAQGLTNPEIGQQIFISDQTVKVHTRNIFGKLGVNSRRQAVVKARDLGLLP
ncbi:MAG: helix-turn-helix transcriptional regulator [Anaerolineae bacterium]|nr:helix-turn-helix transcriptional regulator [Anaerolineae bacterium]